MYMKDQWRPFYEGVTGEGQIIKHLNSKGVRNVPTCVAFGDVGAHEKVVDGKKVQYGGQETEASRYSLHVGRKMVERHIRPLPCSRGRGGKKAETAQGGEQCVPRAVTSAPGKIIDNFRATNVDDTEPSASGRTIPRGTKRTLQQAISREIEQGQGCRHMIHHRVVTVEICLDFNEFINGRNWVTVTADNVLGKSAVISFAVVQTCH